MLSGCGRAKVRHRRAEAVALRALASVQGAPASSPFLFPDFLCTGPAFRGLCPQGVCVCAHMCAHTHAKGMPPPPEEKPWL